LEEKGMLEGKVAIVTGAGQGLGAVEALELARLGARVVVNDLGASGDGKGSDEGPGREVVEQIRKAGGEAIAHFGDVADWESARRMVELAVKTFGDLNIVVNNAGFVRDRMIFNMSEEEWDGVIRVHLKGHFAVSRWAASYWREQAKARGALVYGRVINTSSEAFLLGSPGQPNYAAAKAGIVALTLSIAQACQRYGVNANVICPRARTRMTLSTVPQFFQKPEEGFDVFAPENVTPLVAYLASPAAERVSGQVFIVYGGQVSVLAAPTIEHRFDREGAWTPEDLAAALNPFYEKREPIRDGFLAALG
jgi:3-oxoacyl-[acyl-carrier protein] reductase